MKQDAEQAVVVPSSEQISKEQEEESQPSSSSQMSKSERHIHFNDEVMQCIAIEEYSDDENEDDEYDSDEDYDDNYDYYDEDESSGNQLAQSQIYEGDDESIDDDDEDTDDEDDEDDDDEDDGGFSLKFVQTLMRQRFLVNIRLLLAMKIQLFQYVQRVNKLKFLLIPRLYLPPVVRLIRPFNCYLQLQSTMVPMNRVTKKTHILQVFLIM